MGNPLYTAPETPCTWILSLFQWPMATARCPPLPHTTAIQRGLSDAPRRSQWLVKVVGGVVVLEVEVVVRVWDSGGASDGI